MTVINANSFEVESTETASFGLIEEGTVEVTLGRETRRVKARRTTPTYEGGKPSIAAYGFGGRYNTGSKVWPAVVRMTIWPDGKQTETANFGRDDRDSKFNKMRGIFFA